MPATMTVHDTADQVHQLTQAADKMPVTVATFVTEFGTIRVRKRNTPDGPAYSLTANTAVGMGLIGLSQSDHEVPLDAATDDDARRVGLCLFWNGLVAAVNEVDAICRELGLPEVAATKAAKGRKK